MMEGNKGIFNIGDDALGYLAGQMHKKSFLILIFHVF